MKRKVSYYVVYGSDNGISNMVVQMNGGIEKTEDLQGLVNKIAQATGYKNVIIINWKHLIGEDELVMEDENEKNESYQKGWEDGKKYVMDKLEEFLNTAGLEKEDVTHGYAD